MTAAGAGRRAGGVRRHHLTSVPQIQYRSKRALFWDITRTQEGLVGYDMTLDQLCCFFSVLLFLLYTHLFIGMYLVYQSPRLLFASTPAFATATRLVDCAKDRMPLIDWGKIETCLQKSVVYSVRNGRVPYMDTVPTAFVLHRLDNKSIFVTSKYHSMHTESQALVVIHECAHIGLGAVDLAYVWQNKFKFLTEGEHLANADSYSYKVWENCGHSHSSLY